MRSNESDVDEVNRIARLLMDAWAKAEPDHGVTKYPVSYIATFVDMARAVVRDRRVTMSKGLNDELLAFAVELARCAIDRADYITNNKMIVSNNDTFESTAIISRALLALHPECDRLAEELAKVTAERDILGEVYGVAAVYMRQSPVPNDHLIKLVDAVDKARQELSDLYDRRNQ